MPSFMSLYGKTICDRSRLSFSGSGRGDGVTAASLLSFGYDLPIFGLDFPVFCRHSNFSSTIRIIFLAMTARLVLERLVVPS